jgi:hypothetical protein
MPTLLSPFQNDASGNQYDASSPENNQPDNGRPLNLSLIKRCIERNKNEEEDSNLSYAFAQQLETIAQFMPFSILPAGWGIAQDALRNREEICSTKVTVNSTMFRCSCDQKWPRLYKFF